MHTLDLHFLDNERAIASFLIPSTDGLILVESGPHSTFPKLKAAIKELGYDWTDVRHVILTHIHFDHAGAAWAFAENGAKVYVHPFGIKHLHNPEKLYNSAKQIYGDQMETLWGAMNGIAADKLVSIEDQEIIQIGEHSFQALHTPGHAQHHIAWVWGNKIFCGDVAGVKIDNGPVMPPCPPPDINLELWAKSIEMLKNHSASELLLTHYGSVQNKEAHLDQLWVILQDWAEWIREKWETGLSANDMTPLFTAYTTDQLKTAGANDQLIAQYEAANPTWMSVAGLIRYWKKRPMAEQTKGEL